MTRNGKEDDSLGKDASIPFSMSNVRCLAIKHIRGECLNEIFFLENED